MPLSPPAHRFMVVALMIALCIGTSWLLIARFALAGPAVTDGITVWDQYEPPIPTWTVIACAGLAVGAMVACFLRWKDKLLRLVAILGGSWILLLAGYAVAVILTGFRR